MSSPPAAGPRLTRAMTFRESPRPPACCSCRQPRLGLPQGGLLPASPTHAMRPPASAASCCVPPPAADTPRASAAPVMTQATPTYRAPTCNATGCLVWVTRSRRTACGSTTAGGMRWVAEWGRAWVWVGRGNAHAFTPWLPHQSCSVRTSTLLHLRPPFLVQGFEIGEFSLSFRINLNITTVTAETPAAGNSTGNATATGNATSPAPTTPNTEVLALSPSQPFKRDSNRKVAARLLGDLASYQQEAQLDGKWLMIPFELGTRVCVWVGVGGGGGQGGVLPEGVNGSGWHYNATAGRIASGRAGGGVATPSSGPPAPCPTNPMGSSFRQARAGCSTCVALIDCLNRCSFPQARAGSNSCPCGATNGWLWTAAWLQQTAQSATKLACRTREPCLGEEAWMCQSGCAGACVAAGLWGLIAWQQAKVACHRLSLCLGRQRCTHPRSSVLTRTSTGRHAVPSATPSPTPARATRAAAWRTSCTTCTLATWIAY